MCCLGLSGRSPRHFLPLSTGTAQPVHPLLGLSSHQVTSRTWAHCTTEDPRCCSDARAVPRPSEGPWSLPPTHAPTRWRRPAGPGAESARSLSAGTPGRLSCRGSRRLFRTPVPRDPRRRPCPPIPVFLPPPHPVGHRQEGTRKQVSKHDCPPSSTPAGATHHPESSG